MSIRLTVFSLVGLTAISFLGIPYVSGYVMYAGLHGLYLPPILQLLDPGALVGDFSLLFNQSAFTVFDELVASIVRVVPISIATLFFVGEFLVRLVFLASVYFLGKHFLSSKLYALFAAALFIPVATEHTVFIATNIGMAFGLAALACAAYRRFVWGALCIGIVGIFHPISGCVFGAAFGVLFLLSFRELSWRTRIWTMLIPVGGAGLLWFFAPAGGGDLFIRVDDAWKAIIEIRAGLFWNPINAISYLSRGVSYSNTYYFLIYGALLVMLLFQVWYTLSRSAKYITVTCIGLPLIFTIVQFVGVDVLRSVFIAGLQLGRSFFLWELAIVFLIGAYLKEKTNLTVEHITPYIGILVSLFLNVSFLFHLMSLSIFVGWAALHTLSSKIGIWYVRGAVGCLFLGSIMLALLKDHSEIAVYTVGISVVAGFFGVVFLRAWPLYKKIGCGVAVCLIFGMYVGVSIPHISGTYGGLSAVCAHIPEGTIVTEPFTTHSIPLEIICNRGAFVTGQDGDQLIFNRAYAFLWKERIDVVYKAFQEPERTWELLAPYDIAAIVSDHPVSVPGNMEVVGSYYIYTGEE